MQVPDAHIPPGGGGAADARLGVEPAATGAGPVAGGVHLGAAVAPEGKEQTARAGSLHTHTHTVYVSSAMCDVAYFNVNVMN
jgi:hypothetical protein